MKKIFTLFLVVLLSACSSMYYGAWEKLGVEKKDILKRRVVSARDAQEDSRSEFKDALTRLKEAYPLKETELSKVYDKLKSSYDSAESSSEVLRKRIDDMHTVATDLFDEWKEEADQIQTENLKAQSLRQRTDAIDKYKSMKLGLLSSYDKTRPVLAKLKDYVLFLKHNLNAQAVGSLGNESANIQEEIERLISRMQESIKETDSFISTLEK